MTDSNTYELSVVIASHERRELLRRCLESLREQTQPADSYEVIVADDGSADGTAEMVDGLETPYSLRLLPGEKRGKSAALNAGIEGSVGRICLFLDDDIIASPELVAGHISESSDTLGIGPIIDRAPEARDWYARAFARRWERHNAELASRPARWIDCYGANFSAPRAILRDIGGFSLECPVEDIEIAFRLWKAGCVPTYLPSARGIHDDQKGWRRMVRDTREQGAAYVELARRFPGIERDLLLWAAATGPRELALRRLLRPFGFAPAVLVQLGRLLRDERHQDIWLGIIRNLALWQGARRELTRTEWRSITGKSPAAPYGGDGGAR